jgi:hypothetical protein
MDINKMFGRDRWDKNRGVDRHLFARADEDEAEGLDQEDPYSHVLKPKGVPVWTHPPSSPAEEAIYYGVHIHSESNPLGLHTHIPGGNAVGAHTHSPQNRYGSHHHKNKPGEMTQVDGDHTHGGVNYPDGSHDHSPENFG